MDAHSGVTEMKPIYGVLVLLLLFAGVQGAVGAGEFVYERSWGTFGSGVGQFKAPTGVAVSSEGYVYVTDTGNNRVQRFTTDGRFLRTWGTWGVGAGQFKSPIGISVEAYPSVGKDQAKIVDSANDRVQWCSFWYEGDYTPWAGIYQGSGYTSPYGIVQWYDREHITDERGDWWLVSDRGQNQLCLWPNAYLNLKPNITWGVSGSAPGQFLQPSGLAVRSVFLYNWHDVVLDNEWMHLVYVVDTNNHRYQNISMYRDDHWDTVHIGDWIQVVGGYGSSAGRFNRPTGIAYSRDFLFVTDSGNNRVQVFRENGDYYTEFGGYGSGDGQFNNPTGIAVDGEGNIYVADTGNNRVVKYSSTPHPEFNAVPRKGYAPLTVQFTDTSGGANPVQWQWAFGDNTYSGLQNPTHEYAGIGTYSVSLDVRTVMDVHQEITKTDFISVLPLWNGLMRYEAEDFDQSGYHDTTHGNSGGAYNLIDDVDIVALPGDDRYAVTDTREGEWTRYTVGNTRSAQNAYPTNCTYPLALRVKATRAGRSIDVQVNGVTTTTLTVRASSLGFSWVNTTVELPPGMSTLTFIHHERNFDPPELDFDYFTLDPSSAVVGIRAVPDAPPLVPTDTDGDGLYDDVNGNGRRDFADVVLFFNQMTWIADHEPVGLFDYNGNGRIDFADVTWLFNNL